MGEDQRVPTIDGVRRRSINLDHAASTPPLAAVHEAVERFVPWYSSIHRGAGYRSQVASRAYEGARAAVADFVDADDDQVVVLVRNTTEALNVLAGAFPASSRVLCSSMEHHANLLPWRAHDLEMLPFPASPEALLETCEAALARASRQAVRPARRDRRVERHGRGLADPRARAASRTRTAPGSSSTAPSSHPIGRSACASSASTSSRSRATSCTRRTARAR